MCVCVLVCVCACSYVCARVCMCVCVCVCVVEGGRGEGGSADPHLGDSRGHYLTHWKDAACEGDSEAVSSESPLIGLVMRMPSSGTSMHQTLQTADRWNGGHCFLTRRQKGRREEEERKNNRSKRGRGKKNDSFPSLQETAD